MSCEFCKFWVVHGKGFGVCKRFAPRAVIGRAMPDWDDLEEGVSDWHVPSWPVTYADDFCGDWVSKPKEPRS